MKARLKPGETGYVAEFFHYPEIPSVGVVTVAQVRSTNEIFDRKNLRWFADVIFTAWPAGLLPRARRKRIPAHDVFSSFGAAYALAMKRHEALRQRIAADTNVVHATIARAGAALGKLKAEHVVAPKREADDE